MDTNRRMIVTLKFKSMLSVRNRIRSLEEYDPDTAVYVTYACLNKDYFPDGEYAECNWYATLKDVINDMKSSLANLSSHRFGSMWELEHYLFGRFPLEITELDTDKCL